MTFKMFETNYSGTSFSFEQSVSVRNFYVPVGFCSEIDVMRPLWFHGSHNQI